MHPFARWFVLGVVAWIVSGALIAIAVLGRDTQASVYALLGAGILSIAVGLLLFVQAWIWSQRSWRAGFAGRSALIAVAGGIALLVAAGALGATIILVLTFGLG